MHSTRRARLQSMIREEIATALARDIKDPRVDAITLTSVEVTADGSHATIFFSRFGATPEQIRDSLAGLASASGFLRKKLGPVLKLRHIPTLSFKEDRGFENVFRVNELLREIKGQSE